MTEKPDIVDTINAILQGEDNSILLVQRDQLERVRDEIERLRIIAEGHRRECMKCADEIERLRDDVQVLGNELAKYKETA